MTLLDYDFASGLSDTLGCYPITRSGLAKVFGCPTVTDDGTSSKTKPHTIVYITSNTDHPRFSIRSTGRSLHELLDDTALIECEISSIRLKGKRSTDIVAPPNVEEQRHFLDIVNWKGGDGYAHVHCEAFDIVEHMFDTQPFVLDEAVQLAASKIYRLLRAYGSGDSFLFGVATTVQTGRLIISDFNDGDETSRTLRYERGEEQMQAIGLHMRCYLMLREDGQNWMLTEPIDVQTWDTPLFHRAIDHCHGKDDNPENAFFVDFEFTVPKKKTEDDVRRKPVSIIQLTWDNLKRSFSMGKEGDEISDIDSNANQDVIDGSDDDVDVCNMNDDPTRAFRDGSDREEKMHDELGPSSADRSQSPPVTKPVEGENEQQQMVSSTYEMAANKPEFPQIPKRSVDTATTQSSSIKFPGPTANRRRAKTKSWSTIAQGVDSGDMFSESKAKPFPPPRSAPVPSSVESATHNPPWKGGRNAHKRDDKRSHGSRRKNVQIFERGTPDRDQSKTDNRNGKDVGIRNRTCNTKKRSKRRNKGKTNSVEHTITLDRQRSNDMESKTPRPHLNMYSVLQD